MGRATVPDDLHCGSVSKTKRRGRGRPLYGVFPCEGHSFDCACRGLDESAQWIQKRTGALRWENLSAAEAEGSGHEQATLRCA
jgi:hypothetical protein